MTTPKRKRRNFSELAEELDRIADRPENDGKRWEWYDIGLALGVSAPTAQHLVQWMRRNWVTSYWTVAAGTNYTVAPTKSLKAALAGILSQQKHLITRLETLQKSAATLATVDPDLSWAKLAARMAKHYERRLGDEREFRETLMSFG